MKVKKTIKTKKKIGPDYLLSIADLSSEGIILHNNQEIVEVNNAACKILGYSRKELIGSESFKNIASPQKEQLKKISASKKATTIEVPFHHKSGEMRWIKLRSKTILYKDVELRANIFRDITNKKRAEDFILKTEERFKRLSEASFEALVIHSNGKIVDVNKVCSDLFGYSTEELLQLQAHELAVEDDQQFIKDQIKSGTQKPYEARGLKKDGTVFFAELVGKNILTNNTQLRVAAIRDISERKDYELKLRQITNDYQTLITQSPDGIFIVNDEGKILFANPSAYHILGIHSFKEIKDKSIFEFTIKKYHKLIQERNHLLNQGFDLPFMKMEAKRRDGTSVEVEYKPVLIDYQGERAILIVYHDIDFQEQLAREKLRFKIAEETNSILKNEIDERIKVEKKLKKSLHEKEILLKEVHHRVKNNMQVISSILNLQCSYLTDQTVIDLLRESQNRIRSMSYIHESLYHTEDFTTVNFAKYIQNITNNLFYSYKPKAKKIDFKQKIDDVFLTLDVAIPCGLIINELVSNALKYAFTEVEIGTLQIEVKNIKANTVKIVIEDDGKGVPSDFDIEKSQSLGLQLVKVLTEQLNATLNIESVHGLKYTLMFNK